jgi:aryl-alcohol dehydrogenase-like predicted oxidoreductase
MQTMTLGRTGRTISRIGLGAMRLSLGDRPDPDTARAVVRTAIENGITFIDTADVYCIDDDDIGHNERLVAGVVRDMGVTADVTIATKGGMTRPGGQWQANGRPEHLRAACERSLRALGVERIDLYQFHTPDPAVPFLDSIGALADLLAEGMIAGVGLSNVSLTQVCEAQAVLPVTSVQNLYNPWTLPERGGGMAAFCAEEGITFLPYAPLGRRSRAGLLAVHPPLLELAGRVGCSPHELVLAWMVHVGPATCPIPGPSRPASAASCARAGSLVLDDGTAAAVRAAFRSLPDRTGFFARALGRARAMLRT